MLGVLQKVLFGARFGKRYDPSRKISLWMLENGRGAALRLKASEGYEFTKVTADELRALRVATDEILEQIRKHDQ